MSAEANREAIAEAAVATAVQPDEQHAAHLAALEEQKRGYQARLAVLESGRFDWAGEKRLHELVAGVDAELAKHGSKPAKRAAKTEPKPAKPAAKAKPKKPAKSKG